MRPDSGVVGLDHLFLLVTCLVATGLSAVQWCVDGFQLVLPIIAVLLSVAAFPLYVGYIRGATTGNSTTERRRGWVCLAVGSFTMGALVLREIVFLEPVTKLLGFFWPSPFILVGMFVGWKAASLVGRRLGMSFDTKERAILAGGSVAAGALPFAVAAAVSFLGSLPLMNQEASGLAVLAALLFPLLLSIFVFIVAERSCEALLEEELSEEGEAYIQLPVGPGAPTLFSYVSFVAVALFFAFRRRAWVPLLLSVLLIFFSLPFNGEPAVSGPLKLAASLCLTAAALSYLTLPKPELLRSDWVKRRLRKVQPR